MHEFRDTKDRTWKLEITCETLMRVKGDFDNPQPTDCGVNLLDLADAQSNLLAEVSSFPPLLAKLLFSALSDQAAVKGVDAKEFRLAMSGDALAAATDALLAEIVRYESGR